MAILSYYRKFPLVYLAAAGLSGIGLSGLFPINPVWILVGLAFSFSGLLLLDNEKFLATFLIAVFFCGWLHNTLHKSQEDVLVRAAEILHDKDVFYTGIVESTKLTKKGQKNILRNIEVKSEDASNQLPLKYFLFTKIPIDCGIGDTLRGTGGFERIRERRNPGDFDFRSFYHRKNIVGWVFQTRQTVPQIFLSEKLSMNRTIADLRNKISSQFSYTVGPEYGGLLTALLTGDKNEVNPETKESFVATGVVHVLAVSGLHVGYVLIILLFIAQVLRIPWGWNRIIVIGGLIFFCFLTGWKPSVIRASMMAGLYVLAPVLNRPANLWNIIAAAAIIILAWDPSYIYDLGFQLSFSAVISIVLFYNLINDALPETLKVNHIQHTSLRFVWGLFLVSFSAQIGTLPFTAFYFNRIPIIALVANIFIVPLIGVMVCIGFFILSVGLIPVVGNALGHSAWFLGKTIDTLASTFASVPYGNIQVGQLSEWNLMGYGLFLIGIIFLLIPRWRSKGILTLLFLGNMVVWSWALKPKTLDVLFMDVGQGDAALVRFENGQTMLIDAGQKNHFQDSGEEMVLPVLRAMNIKHLDWVVMSHPHSDHIGGLVTVLEQIPVDSIWDTHLDYDSWTYNHILELTQEKHIGYRKLIRGEINRIDENTAIQVLAPDTTFIKHERNVNNSSIVMKLIHGQNSFLFTGDLEHEGDAFLLTYGSVLKSDVLKVGHHGSITSTTEAFLELVKPDWAVVSVGEKNKFKHPSPVVMNRLKEMVPEIRRTNYDRAVWLRSDRDKIWVVEWK